MKNRKIQKILSSIISLSVISSVIPVSQVVNAASNTSGLYSSPEVYINDTFHQSSALATEDRLTDSGEPVVTASGWDVTGGGYLTGKNSGGDFDFVDNSTTEQGRMVKKISEISSGMVQWEFTARTKELTSTFNVLLSDFARISFDRGTVSYICDGKLTTLGSYVKTTEVNGVTVQSPSVVKVKSYINLNDNTVAVYMNGVMIATDLTIPDGRKISQIQIVSNKLRTGTLNISECKITKDFILSEGFNYEDHTREWNNTITSPYRGIMYNDQLRLAAGKMAERDISHGNVEADERVEFQYRFISDSLVNADKVMSVQAPRTYENLLSDEMANCNTNDALGESSTFNYSVVNDSTAVDGKAIQVSSASNSSLYRDTLFEYAIPYQELQSKGKDFNLSFDIKKSSDLTLVRHADSKSAKLSTYGFVYKAKYTDASGNSRTTDRIVYWNANSPRFLDTTGWQHTTYNYDIDYAAIEAKVLEDAGEGATIDEIVFVVHLNGAETKHGLSAGSYWLDNISVAPIEDSSEVMSLNLTSDGNITLTGSGDAVNVGKYRAGIWQNVRITYDRSTGNATVRHNHLTETVVPVNKIAPENLIFANNGTGTITVDDVTVKKVYDLPSDYVPKPNKTADDGYYSSLLSCALWTENGSRIWDAISGFDERSPVLGFYDEGKPEVSDWEIKYMVEHGIDSQIFCWFDSDRYNNGGAIPAFKDAEYSDMLDYSLMWTNTSSATTASLAYRDQGYTLVESFQKLFREVYVPYWIDNYFSDNNYTKLDGKPVLYVNSSPELLAYLGGGDTSVLTEQLQYLNEKCEEAGLNGVKVILNSDNISSGMVDGTYAVGTFTYGYNERNPQALDSKWTASETSSNTALPVLGLHHNSEAWNGIVDHYTTPAEYEQLANEVKNRMTKWNYSNIYSTVGSDKNGISNEKLLVMDNWNEMGEGHWMMPTKTFGFTYLDVFRKTFIGDSAHTDIVPDENQKKRINVLYDQTRRRREGANVASSDEKSNIVKLWDFTKSGMTTSNIGEGNLSFIYVSGGKITSGVGIQGTTTNAHAIVGITGLNIDLESTGYDTVYVKTSENVDSSIVLMNTTYTNDNGEEVNITGYSTGVSFKSDWNSGLVREHFVYMDNHASWNGTLKTIYVRVPVSLGDSFTIEAIGLAKNNMFDLGDELIVNGSFEDDEVQYTCEGVTAEYSHFDFNRGAEALKVSGNGTIKLPVENAKANTTYQLEAFAKLPFGTTTNSSLTAYLSYNVGGATKKSNSVTLPKFLDQGFARLYEELEIKEDAPISDVKLCITNAGGTTYYLDDVSLRKLDSVYTDSENVANGIENGIKLEFAENINIANASATCLGETLSVSKAADNIVLVSLPTAASGKNNIILSGLKTAMGQEMGIISIDIQSGVDSINSKYYTGYGTASQATVTPTTFVAGTTVTGVAKITNNSTTTVTGNVISAFYKGNELLKVVFTPFTAGSTAKTVTYEFEVPSGFDSYKEFVWSTDWEPLLK